MLKMPTIHEMGTALIGVSVSFLFFYLMKGEVNRPLFIAIGSFIGGLTLRIVHVVLEDKKDR